MKHPFSVTLYSPLGGTHLTLSPARIVERPRGGAVLYVVDTPAADAARAFLAAFQPHVKPPMPVKILPARNPAR